MSPSLSYLCTRTLPALDLIVVQRQEHVHILKYCLKIVSVKSVGQVATKACADTVQSTNPLARCVEYLQEDLETMTTELNFWAEERRRFQVQHAKWSSMSYHVSFKWRCSCPPYVGQVEMYADPRPPCLVIANKLKLNKLVDLQQ